MSDQPHQELADALSGIMTVVESHATVAGFWMGEHAKARLAADDLQSEIYQLQEQIEELRNRDESEELKALQAKLDVSQKELRASKKANHELVHTEVLMTQQIGLLKTKVSDERERYSALNQSLADQKAKIESDLETSQARITEMETEIAAAKNAATIMSEKVAAPGQETAGDQGWISSQNRQLKDNIRKIGDHLERVDREWSENPDAALRALSYAQKLVTKSATIGGKKS